MVRRGASFEMTDLREGGEVSTRPEDGLGASFEMTSFGV
jgi:hypothetical protein